MQPGGMEQSSLRLQHAPQDEVHFRAMNHLFLEYFHITVHFKKEIKTLESKTSDKVDGCIYKVVQVRAKEMVQWAEELAATHNSQHLHGEKHSH